MTNTEYLRRADAASFLGLSVSTLANWASAGRGPTYHKMGRVPMYSLAELRRFVESQTVKPLI
jgi:predicted DNA-binding transcriptional regulator AlpA